MRTSFSLLGLTLFAGPAVAQTCLYRVVAYDDAGFGTVVRSGGDVDGDGVQDWIAGIPVNDTLAQDGGAIRVCSGVDGHLLHSIYWTEAGGIFGSAVDIVGDVNGDGRADFICGAPGSELGGDQSGAVVVYSGKNSDTVYQIAGDPESLFGTSVTGLGDLDGDGRAEFVVGAPWDDTIGTDGGAVRVYSGTGVVLHEIFGNPGTNFGRCVARAGDVDGDGKTDLLATAQLSSPTPSFDGYARVYSGATFALLETFTPPQLGTGSAYAIVAAGAGDVDADGFDDVIVGAPRAGSFAGEAYVYSGKTGALLHTVQGTQSSWLGGSVAGAGDVNGDGYDDVAVGANREKSGNADIGAVHVHSGADGAELFSIIGYVDEEGVGLAVASTGDLDGDGDADFLVGAKDRVEAYSPDPNRVVYCVAAPNSAGPGAHIGSKMSTSISAADFVLTASGCPSGQFGLFFFGENETQVAFGDGYLCVTAPLRRLPVVQVNASGIATQTLWGHGMAEQYITPGSTWRFQLWYRDPFGPLSTGSNASDAMRVTFCP